MMKTKLEIIRGSTSLDLSDDEHFMWTGDNNFGILPVRRLQERGPLQHGYSDRGFLADARQVQLRIMAWAETYAEAQARRLQLVNMFSPGAMLRLRLTLPSGAVRQLDVHYSGGMSFNSQHRRATVQNVVIELMAASPAWYDPARKIIAITGGSGGFEVPAVVPADVGSNTIDALQEITYPGSWREYPEIEIVGPVNNPVITHVQLDTKIDLTGVELALGERRLITTAYGQQTIIDPDEADPDEINKIWELSDDSGLTSFYFAPAAELPGNTLHVTGTMADSGTRINIRYYNRYAGV